MKEWQIFLVVHKADDIYKVKIVTFGQIVTVSIKRYSIEKCIIVPEFKSVPLRKTIQSPISRCTNQLDSLVATSDSAKRILYYVMLCIQVLN